MAVIFVYISNIQMFFEIIATFALEKKWAKKYKNIQYNNNNKQNKLTMTLYFSSFYECHVHIFYSGLSGSV